MKLLIAGRAGYLGSVLTPDDFVTPTATSDLAHPIVRLSRCDSHGLYHATTQGNCSWYGFDREIFSKAAFDFQVKLARPGEFPGKAPRPHFSVLETRQLKISGLNLFDSWQVGLQHCLANKNPCFGFPVALRRRLRRFLQEFTW
jgi:dTDP-4-dehydrorhamnose reductase